MSSALQAEKAVTTVARSPSTIYLGMDVHKDSITIAVLPEGLEEGIDPDGVVPGRLVIK